jgi:hypothetical protein
MTAVILSVRCPKYPLNRTSFKAQPNCVRHCPPEQRIWLYEIIIQQEMMR